MKKLLLALIACLFASISATAHATTLQGLMRYKRNWTDCGAAPLDRVQCSVNGTLKGVQGMIVTAVKAGGAEVVSTTTDSSGNYVFSGLSGGATYSIRTQERDGTLGNSGSFGTAHIAVVQSFSTPMAGYDDVVATTASLPTGNVIVTFNVDINSTIDPAALDRINTYQMYRFQQALWENQSFVLPTSLYRMRVRNVANTSATGLGCFGSDCVAEVGIKLSLRGNEVAWHEMGHGIWDLVMKSQIGDVYRPGDTGCPGIGNTGVSSFTLQEGWADFVYLLTRFPANGIPANFNGGVCNSCLYPPTGAQPSPPACGSGSITRVRDYVYKGFVELVDTGATDVACRPETLAAPLGDMLEAWTFFTADTSGACGASIKGVEETGIEEGNNNCASSTPNWPYTGSNALPVADQSGFLDYLGIMKHWLGYDGNQLLNVWANTCWQPADSQFTLP